MDPITARHSPLSWPEPYTYESPQAKVKKVDTHSAEAELAALFYQSSIQSLNPSVANGTEKTAKAVNEAVEHKPSFWGRLKDWFYNLVGISKTKADMPEPMTGEDEEADNAPSVSINRPPQLEPPKEAERKYAQSMSALNKEIIKRCDDEIERLEEQFRNASPQKIEVMIHWKFLELSLKQRSLIVAHRYYFLNRRYSRYPLSLCCFKISIMNH